MRYAQGEGPMYLPSEVQKQPQINAAVSEVVKELSPWVRHIRYDIAQDWSGEWGVFFRVLLSDEASKRKNLRQVTPQVISRLSERVYVPDLGLHPYFNFRSESEQAQLIDPAWA